VSQIFDALIRTQDKTAERLKTLSSLQELESDSTDYWQSTARPMETDLFARVKDFAGQLPGKVTLSHKKIRNYLILVFCAVGLVLLGTDYAFRVNGGGFPSSSQLYGVAFEGTIHPAVEIRITSELTGTVSVISVKVGDPVQKGQPLLRLDDREAELALKQASVDLMAAEANLDKFSVQLAEANARVAISQRQQQQVPTRQWRDSPERAEAAYDQAMTNYNRTKQLFETGVIAQQELDARTTELRMARDDLDNARRLADVSSNLDHDQTDQATLQAKITRQGLQELLLQARLKYERAKQQVDGTVVRATQPGVVSEISVRLGDRIPGGTLLARLAELNRMIVEVPVAGKIVSELKVGQPARVALPSSPPSQVEGRIRVINPLPSSNMTHAVEVEFENPALLLLAGQPAEVRFVNP
jgi:multidrug resistance efflux pump